MTAYFLQVEMLQAPITGVMKKNQYQHDFRLGHGGGTVIFSFLICFQRVFAIISSKNLQKSSAIQNNSITLFSVIIAIVVCNTL
jgi:hypothetical protein